MRTRYYIMALTVGALVPALAALGLVQAALAYRPEEGRWVAECIGRKTQAAREHAPKLVILSGSSGHFGFSARRLSEQYGLASVNASLHAGLGLGYLLHFGRTFFAPGRTIVLPLEYELYGPPAYEYAYRDHVVGYDPDYYRSLPLTEKLTIARHYTMGDRLRVLTTMYERRPHPNPRGYQAKTVDGWGDETGNDIAARTPAMLERAKRTGPKLYSIDRGAWAQITAFVKDARAAGCQVVLAYPNIYAKSLDVHRNEAFFAELTKRAAELTVPLLGRPEEAVFGDDRCFDTYYHENSVGQIASTDRLYRELVEGLGREKLLAGGSVPRVPMVAASGPSN